MLLKLKYGEKSSGELRELVPDLRGNPAHDDLSWVLERAMNFSFSISRDVAKDVLMYHSQVSSDPSIQRLPVLHDFVDTRS